MLFSIIYDFDIRMSCRVGDHYPRKSIRNKMHLTESSDGELSDSGWDIKVKHRKLAGILNKEEFKQFLDDTGLFPEDVRTMGSLGAPGCGFGCSSAISFRDDDPDAIKSAYVTPLADGNKGEPLRKNGATERDFERMRTAIFNTFS